MREDFGTGVLAREQAGGKAESGLTTTTRRMMVKPVTCNYVYANIIHLSIDNRGTVMEAEFG